MGRRYGDSGEVPGQTAPQTLPQPPRIATYPSAFRRQELGRHRVPHLEDLPALRGIVGAKEYRIESRLLKNDRYPVALPKFWAFAERPPSEPDALDPIEPPVERTLQLGLLDYAAFWNLGERRARHLERQRQERECYERERLTREVREQAWLKAHQHWTARRDAYDGACSRARAAWQQGESAWLEAWGRESAEFARLRKGYLSGKPKRVSMWIAAHLDVLPLPSWCPATRSIAFDAAERVLVLDCPLPFFPGLEVQATKLLKSGPKIAGATQKNSREFASEFSYLLVLALIWEAAHADESDRIGLICCNGSVKYDDPATGRQRQDVILSVAAKPAELRQIVLERVEPEACFRRLRGVAAPKLMDLVPVQPIVQFDRNDPRFIADKNVLQEVEGMNLATMEWQDFEFLIRELFERAFAAHGAEVRVTQASRDRGVDAIIFDPHPLRGGKTVVQAKRYTTTVDLSAVRDLYGTVHAEGAIQGILVTTSSFGPDAYDFVKDKPLKLINGANLLHLLEQHGYRARIDIKEARELIRERSTRDGPLN